MPTNMIAVLAHGFSKVFSSPLRPLPSKPYTAGSSVSSPLLALELLRAQNVVKVARRSLSKSKKKTFSAFNLHGTTGLCKLSSGISVQGALRDCYTKSCPSSGVKWSNVLILLSKLDSVPKSKRPVEAAASRAIGLSKRRPALMARLKRPYIVRESMTLVQA